MRKILHKTTDFIITSCRWLVRATLPFSLRKRFLNDFASSIDHRQRVRKEKYLLHRKMSVLLKRKVARLKNAKAVVIAIRDNELSMQAASRCILSAAMFGHEVVVFPALTPKDKPLDKMRDLGFGMPKDRLAKISHFARLECVAGHFLTNYRIWQLCVAENRPYLILEHDAVFVERLPKIEFRTIVNLGKPMRTNCNPQGRGLLPLQYVQLPGTHAYAVHPEEAARLLRLAPHDWTHLDVFLSVERIFAMQEYLPHPIICDDHFSTITNPNRPMDTNPNYLKYKDSYKFVEID